MTSAFTVHLHSGRHYERLENAVAFTGESSSGKFGILAHHERFLTLLDYGLAKIRFLSGESLYLALPEALLYFRSNELRLTTRSYVKSADYREISKALERQSAEDERRLKEIRKNLRQLDEEVLKRILKVRFLKV